MPVRRITNSMKKKIIIFVGIILLVGFIWYLFLKPYDYLVTFKAKTFPGTINQTIKIWNSTMPDSEILGQEGILALTQRLHFGDSTHIYDWKITAVNDSLSKVRVYVKDPNHSLMNKVSIPFSDTDFEKRSRETLTDFNKKLNEHIESFKVKIVGKEEIKSTFCACTTVHSTQFGKARGMMNGYPLLSTFLVENKVELNGLPFLELTQWHKKTDSIQFEFCFPIIRSQNLPQNADLHYKQFTSKKAIKAIYNGNYITSDRAWYALEDYAKKNKLEITGLPIEIFHNNPNMGGDELNWKAEIYIPLKETMDE